MAGPFNVRIFGYRGIVQVQQRLVKQYNSDSVFLLDDPYVWSQILPVPGGGAAVSSAVVAVPSPDPSQILRVEVPDGQQIRYEINPNGPTAVTARIAGTNSPRLSGFDQFVWANGYTISVCDAAAFL
jgi:hypothetical protein